MKKTITKASDIAYIKGARGQFIIDLAKAKTDEEVLALLNDEELEAVQILCEQFDYDVQIAAQRVAMLDFELTEGGQIPLPKRDQPLYATITRRSYEAACKVAQAAVENVPAAHSRKRKHVYGETLATEINAHLSYRALILKEGQKCLYVTMDNLGSRKFPDYVVTIEETSYKGKVERRSNLIFICR